MIGTAVGWPLRSRTKIVRCHSHAFRSDMRPFIVQCPRAVFRVVAPVLAAASVVSGQAAAPIAEGARILVLAGDKPCTSRWRPCRVTASASGTLVRVTADTFSLQLSPSASMNVLRQPNQRIFVSQGKPRLRSALEGALYNGVLTYMIADLTNASRRSTIGWSLGMSAGGFMAGAVLPREHWRRTPLP